MSTHDTRPPPGPVPIQRYGKYYLVHKLAEGGMAEIFLAKQVGVEGFEKNVVVKRMLAHLSGVSDFVSMFLDEARLASRLSHPNVVQVLDLGFEEGCYFIAMEYLAGEDFSTVIRSAAKQRAYVPLSVAMRVLADAALGLHYAHTFTDSKGQPLKVVHRDVSPSNIFVTYSGQVKMLDFGIAKAESRVTNTTAGVVKGKYQYMSPEQAQTMPVDARADVYSLGVCMYEALCNARPFARDTDLAILNAVLKNEYKPARQLRPDLPVELEQILVKALALKADERFQSAAEFAGALEAFLRASTSVTTGTAITHYMATFFGQERVASKTRIDSLDEMKAKGVPVPPMDGRTTSNSAMPVTVVPREESTNAIGAPRAVTGERRPLPLVPVVIGALLIGVLGTAGVLAAVSGRRVDPPPVLVPPPPVEPVPAVIDAGAAEPVDAGAVAVAPSPPDAGPLVVDAGSTSAPQPDNKRPAAPVVLSSQLISATIKRNAASVVRCFQEHRADLPGAAGKVDVTITIDRAGRVRDVSSPLAATNVGACLEKRLKAVKFPAHVDESVTVTLPLSYKVQ